MEILQLKYFKDAAETENFSKTAQKYTVPTSAVSQSIRRLENEMGTQLFDRFSNRISLNEEGRLLYQAVCQMQQMLENTRRQFADHSQELSGEICLQIACNRRIVSDAIQQFSRLHPKVRFVLRHGTAMSERFDLIISDDEQLKAHYACTELITEKISVAFAKEHPFAAKDRISVRELSGESFVTMQNGGRLHFLTEHLCMQAGFYPKISIQCDDPYYIRKYIEMGMGIGFVPMFSWRGQLPEGIICRELVGVSRITYAYWDPAGYLPKAAREFLDLLRTLCNESMQP